MNIKYLSYFIVLAESSSINEAAQKLFIAQPSLTKALHQLEAELGFTLFERNRSGIKLTSIGQRILPDARQIVDFYQEWLTLPKENTLTSIEIHVHVSFSNFLFPSTILQMKKKYPELSITYTSHNKPDRFISRNTKTPVLTMFACDDKEKLEQFTQQQGNPPDILFVGSYTCLVSVNSPLAKCAWTTQSELRNYMLLLPRIKDLVRDPAYSRLDGLVHNMPPEKIIEVGSLENVINLVCQQPNTFAISYYPALMRYQNVQNGGLTHIPIQDNNKEGFLCLFYSKRAYQQHPAVRDLVQAVRRSAQTFLDEHNIKPLSTDKIDWTHG